MEKPVARTPSSVISTWFRTDEGVRPTFFHRGLELTNDLAVAAISQRLVRGVVDVLADKPHRAIAEENMHSADMLRLEPLGCVPVAV